MGVRGLPSLLNDADVPKDDVHSFADKNVHVDLLGTYFALVRALYFKHLQQEAAKIARQSPLNIALATARTNVRAAFNSGRQAQQHDARLRFIAEALHKKFERIGLDQTRTTIHLDGDRPNEKRHEHAARDAKNTRGLRQLNALFVQTPQAPQQQQQQQQPRLRKHSIEAIERKAKSLVHVPREVLRIVCDFLQEKGWNVHQCLFEADPCIARHCLEHYQLGQQVYALSSDSDLFVYSSVQDLIRPVWNKKNKFQLFNKQKVLRHLRVNDLQLLLVGIVTQNDYNNQFTNYGVATNLEIARELGITFPDNSLVTDTNVTTAQATMTTVVNTYITRVTGAAATPPAPAAPILNFTDAIFVFAGLAQTPVPAVAGAVVQPPDINQAVLQRLVDLERIKITMRRGDRSAHSHVHRGRWRRTRNPPTVLPAPPPPPPAPALPAPVVLAKSGAHSPSHVDRYDSVSPQADRPRYHRKIINDFTLGARMPANYIQTQGGTNFQVHGPQPMTGGQVVRADPARARVRRGAARPQAQAPAGPQRTHRVITIYKHAMEKVFQTSTLSVGSLKANLRHAVRPVGAAHEPVGAAVGAVGAALGAVGVALGAVGAAPGAVGAALNDDQRILMETTINNAVTTLNNIRSYMLQAIALYISIRLETHSTNSAGDVAYRQRWLDPLLHATDVQVICYNLSSLFAGTSQMLPKIPKGNGHLKKRRRVEGPATPHADAGTGPPPTPPPVPPLVQRIAAGGGMPPSDDRQQIAWDMVKFLVRDLRHDPVIFVPNSVVEKHSREEMAKEVSILVRRHFIELFPILNSKAVACHSGPEVGLDGSNISTVDLIWRFWTMNQRLPPIERIAFSPQAKLEDSFMMLSETSLVDLLWTPNSSTNPAKWTEVRRAATTLCTRQYAANMTQNTGAVIEMLFFGRQSPGNQPKARLSSYDKKRVSMNQLVTGGAWPGMSIPGPAPAGAPAGAPAPAPAGTPAGTPAGAPAPAPAGAPASTPASAPASAPAPAPAPAAGPAPAPASVLIPDVFVLANLQNYNAAVVAFRQNRSRARQNNLPFTQSPPALPTSAAQPSYYVLQGMVRTNGREFQVLAFDLRKPCLPPQRFHLPETEKVIKDIEEVFASRQDITNAFGANVANVPVVGIDPGEVVSAAGCGINIDPTMPNKVAILTVKRAALYAPIFRDRYVMNQLKEEPPPIPRSDTTARLTAAFRSNGSINDIQNGMVGFGDGSSQAVKEHLRAWERAFRKLREFYSSHTYKKRNWARRKAFRAEYDYAVTGLLRLALLDGEMNQLHRKVVPGMKKTLFVYGSARFNTHTKLSSLHTSLMGFFYRKATALGHVVVVADEFRTSSICPSCDAWVAKPTMRSCFCVTPACNRFIHRDILGGHNIARIGDSWLRTGRRPAALSRT